jgi:hypothetical protein
MTKSRKPNGSARPIKTKRDYTGASALVKRLSSQTERDSAAELRLQALLQEMDKFEEIEEDASADSPEEYDYPGPRRRWSDDGAD